MVTTTVSLSLSQPLLQKGSTGPAVQRLQEQLNFYFGARKQLVVDGVFGTRTEQAVKIVQYRYFLVQDGIVGTHTRAVLSNRDLIEKPLLRRGSTGSLVGRVQQVLRDAKLYSGEIDSNFGALTEQAVMNVQALVRLPQTGIIDPETWAALVEKAAMLSF
ncbi:MAG: peptidoglycan-binding protein [Myxacorys chilensis ATA2-1-KO14]|jgi:peptidoglycan hydrolase-like protein with peptidoglycan-binding domain|nr:peptidoglycan-binding protein [Myxacorys chilensis ATA2-1-KO14]